MSTQPLQYKMFSTPRKLSDITRRRHGGNPSSEKANAGITPFKQPLRKMVEEFFLLRRERGATTSFRSASRLCMESGRDLMPTTLPTSYAYVADATPRKPG